MGNIDTSSKAYMSRNKYFADAYNYFAYDGEQIVLPENLTEIDTTQIGIVKNGDNAKMIQKWRDVLKSCVIMHDDKRIYVIMGVENEGKVHYAMPVRNMLYDALEYSDQIAVIAKQHEEKRDLKGDEYVSRFGKNDRILPVVTLVIYFGTKEWDGPRSLKEMFEDTDEQILQFVSDYKMNLIVPKEIEDFSKFSTDLGKALKYISVADQKEQLKAIAQKEEYQNVDQDTAILLKEITGMNIKIETEEDNVNMCQAVIDLLEEGKEEGLEEGKVIGFISALKDVGIPEDIIKEKVLNKYKISKAEIQKYYEKA